MRLSAPDDHPAQAAPELLTQDEVIDIMRLKQAGVRHPRETLRYLRRTGQLGYVKIAGRILIPRPDLDSYIQRQRVPGGV